MQRTVHYRQVDWLAPRENLIVALQHTLNGRPHIENTVHQVSGEECEVRLRSVGAHEVRLHLVTFVTGARKGVRQHTLGQAAADVLEALPPANSDFVEREIAVVIREDRLGYVATGHTFGSTVEKSLRSLLRLQYPSALADRLLLPARVDPNVLHQLIEGGVSRLDLSVALPGPDAQAAGILPPDGLGGAIGRSIWNSISARVLEDHDDADIDALATATANIGIRFGRRPTVEQLESLREVAASAINSGDEFTIRNADGVVFSRDKLTLKSTYMQEGLATTLSVNQAWQETASFLDMVD